MSDSESQRRVARRALRSIRREAGRAALGDNAPEGRKPSPEFMISIGLGGDPADAGEDEDEDDAERRGR